MHDKRKEYQFAKVKMLLGQIMNQDSKPVMIIGAGAAGLMAAEVISAAGIRVQVYEHKPSAARKVLMAGKGGLNISHSEPLAAFVQRYDHPEWLAPMIHAFDAQAIQNWMQSLGITSYIGTSGRVFPEEMKAAPLVRAWIARLKAQGVEFFYRHRWLGWNKAGQQLVADATGQIQPIDASALVLAVGGGSWAALGSDGQALGWLAEQGIGINPLVASNGGVQVAWSPFVQALAGQPLKRVKAWVAGHPPIQSDAVVSGYGLEGGLIYACSRAIRQELAQAGHATLYLDVLPNISEPDLATRLAAHPKDSLSNRWRKAGLDAVKSALIRDRLPKASWTDPNKVAQLAKHLPIRINGLQPINEAISTAGGVALDQLDEHLMLREHQGVFCCGEMLDWDAPTGGYLLTACFATGRQAGAGVLRWRQTTT
jgi:hypothetical protein